MSFTIKSHCLNCNCDFETMEADIPGGETPPCPACSSYDVRSYSPDRCVSPDETKKAEFVKVGDLLDDVYDLN